MRQHLSRPLAALLMLAALPIALDAAGAVNDFKTQGPDWDHIGMAQVDFRGDHDVIRAAGQGRFRSIRIVVEGGDIQMFNVRITFGNGQTFSPRTRLSFDQHSRSREIDLPGATRMIRRIDFSYRSVRGGRWHRATVHVYGRR